MDALDTKNHFTVCSKCCLHGTSISTFYVAPALAGSPSAKLEYRMKQLQMMILFDNKVKYLTYYFKTGLMFVDPHHLQTTKPGQIFF